MRRMALSLIGSSGVSWFVSEEKTKHGICADGEKGGNHEQQYACKFVNKSLRDFIAKIKSNQDEGDDSCDVGEE